MGLAVLAEHRCERFSHPFDPELPPEEVGRQPGREEDGPVAEDRGRDEHDIAPPVAPSCRTPRLAECEEMVAAPAEPGIVRQPGRLDRQGVVECRMGKSPAGGPEVLGSGPEQQARRFEPGASATVGQIRLLDGGEERLEIALGQSHPDRLLEEVGFVDQEQDRVGPRDRPEMR